MLQHLELAREVAERVARGLPRGFGVDDILGDAHVGLLDAATRFDPARGVRFASYASARIRGAIFDEIRRQDWVPRLLRQRISKGLLPADTVRSQISIDPGISERASGTASRIDLLADKLSPRGYTGIEDRELVGRLLTGLQVKERVVVKLYYLGGWTMKEMGDLLRLSESRICQIKERALNALKAKGQAERFRP